MLYVSNFAPVTGVPARIAKITAVDTHTIAIRHARTARKQGDWMNENNIRTNLAGLLENSLLKEALAMSSENCEELMKQSNQEQVRAEQNRQRDAEQNRKLISELKQSVELLKNSNELLQDAISGEIGSLKDEVKENTVQEVRKALQANIEAIQRATKLLEKQSDTLTSVMKQKLRELEESKNSFFRYEGLKLYLFWGGMVCNILVFLMLASSMFGR